MENIGALLKDKRIEKGYSIEEISKLTRLTIKHIRALEDGDMDFFQDDLSYLRFFVKSYCEAVDYDFELIKDELKDDVTQYTDAFKKATILSHQEIENNIKNRDKLSKVASDTPKANREKRKIGLRSDKIRRFDFSFASLIAIVAVVVVGLMFTFILYINSDKKTNNAPSNEELPIANQNKDNVDNVIPKEEEQAKQETKKEIEFTATDLTHFTIENVNEGDPIKFDVQFIGSSSGFTFSVDGVALSEPASKVYNAGSSAQASVVAKKGMKIQVYFGWLLNDPIKINDKTVNIDPSIANSGKSYTFEFTVL